VLETRFEPKPIILIPRYANATIDGRASPVFLGRAALNKARLLTHADRVEFLDDYEDVEVTCAHGRARFSQ